MKVANMKKEQDFTLYPYDGGDTILLQSDKRFARVNLKTGEGFINSTNKNYANSIALAMSPLPFTLPKEIKLRIQEHLWNKSGTQEEFGGALQYENKTLFSQTGS